MFSPLQSGATDIFDLPLFVSTFIFISMKEAGCKLSVNIHSVCGSSVSKLSSRGFNFYQVYSALNHAASGIKNNNNTFSFLDKIVARLLLLLLFIVVPLFHSHETNPSKMSEFSGSMSPGAVFYLSSCQLTSTDL